MFQMFVPNTACPNLLAGCVARRRMACRWSSRQSVEDESMLSGTIGPAVARAGRQAAQSITARAGNDSEELRSAKSQDGQPATRQRGAATLRYDRWRQGPTPYAHVLAVEMKTLDVILRRKTFDGATV
jgi:hypothetical protein